MVALDNPALEHISLVKLQKPNSNFSGIPVINLSRPDSEDMLVRACEEIGFFKVINHGVPVETITRQEAEAMQFFSKPQQEKEKRGLNNSFGYGSKRIGPNGDVGWVEYLLMQISSGKFQGETAGCFLSSLNEFIAEVRRLTCVVLEMMASGLRIEQRDVFSKMVMHEESDSLIRLNHYPPCPPVQGMMDCNLTGFGEHTDPQIISVLRSNNVSGLQISLRDGSWVSVPPDQNSFFICVGDSLQVLTNGRFRSVRHRVLANSLKPRVSMVYFGGPPSGESLAPLPVLMREGEESHYREFTWFEYKSSAYKSKLADDRLVKFEKRVEGGGEAEKLNGI